jgi:dihydroorotase
MQNYLFRNIQVVNEGKTMICDVLVRNGRIDKIAAQVGDVPNAQEINGENKWLLPGVIDDQVHFREPGLTHKATIRTESMAAVAGGVTSFMEMPNTQPAALTQELLEGKYAIASKSSPANYSFFMGTSNDNMEEALRTNEKKRDICGIKIFMGSSTGNLLVDSPLSLDRLFRESEVLIATHCEDERMIRANYAAYKEKKPVLEPADHPLIRDAEVCFESSFAAIQYAKKYGSRLHILHISTARELQLFSNMLPLKDKRITCEACVHHLHFTSDDYERLGYQIKCNPAIKSPENRESIWQALLDNRIDVIATDHAPHLLTEKEGPYEHAHAGLPLVQHSLPLMLHYVKQGKISLERVVEKMSHAVADCFQIEDRGYIREGYFADLVVVDPLQSSVVSKENIRYMCGWSPLEGMEMPATVTHTFVNGHPVYANGQVDESYCGMRLQFNR